VLSRSDPGLNRLLRLPQQVQQTLFLLAVVAWVLLPHMVQAPLWVAALGVSLLLWRATIAIKGQALPTRVTLVAILALIVGSTLWSHQSGFSRDAGVTLVTLLLALKTLEMRAQRDAFVVFFLGFFAVMTQFFSSQSMATAVYMLVAVFGLLTALVSAHMPGTAAPLRLAAGTSLRLAAIGTPMMVFLFVFFPRVAPLWGLNADGPGARSGLSATMSVGSMAELALDDSIALRLRFESTEPSDGALYFRGPVLSRFDGRNWLPLQEAPQPAKSPEPRIQTQGLPLRYELTIEPNPLPWLLTLEATPEAPSTSDGPLQATADLQWRAETGTGRLRRYQAQSYLNFQYGPRQWSPALTVYQELPQALNPRTRAWAAQLRSDPALAQADAQALSAAVLQHLANGQYRYTLAPGLYGDDTADEFWFDKKAGFCEHIASAFVVAMRAAGVPARIVTGYQGAHRNPVDGYWTVRQSDAHAWAEIWQAGQGWIRVDPTAAISPWRLQAPTRLSPPSSAVTQLLATVSPGVWISARALWEALNNQWNQSVLNFGPRSQLHLLRILGFSSPGWEDLGYLMAGLVFGASLIGALWGVLGRKRQDPALALLHASRRRLTAAGLALPPQATAAQMARLAEARWGKDALPVQHWLQAFDDLRYGPVTKNRTFKHLRARWRTLSWPRRLKTKPPP